jgi:hypothetical protein
MLIDRNLIKLILLQVSSEEGFIKGALLTYKAGSGSGDYHRQMNSQNIETWITAKYTQ